MATTGQRVGGGGARIQACTPIPPWQPQASNTHDDARLLSRMGAPEASQAQVVDECPAKEGCASCAVACCQSYRARRMFVRSRARACVRACTRGRVMSHVWRDSFFNTGRAGTKAAVHTWALQVHVTRMHYGLPWLCRWACNAHSCARAHTYTQALLQQRRVDQAGQR